MSHENHVFIIGYDVVLQEIPPYETKPIMKASFIGRIESNHTAFIRIKTNKEKKDKVLILPVEVEVTSGNLTH